MVLKYVTKNGVRYHEPDPSPGAPIKRGGEAREVIDQNHRYLVSISRLERSDARAAFPFPI